MPSSDVPFSSIAISHLSLFSCPLYHITLYYITPYYTSPHYTTPLITTPYYTSPHHTSPHHTKPQHYTTPHHTSPHLSSHLQVGEHLLSLVQELEAFASSDALPDLWRLTGNTQTQSLLSSLSVRGWRQLRVALDIKEEEGAERLCNRSSCVAAIVAAEKGMFGAQLSKLAEEPSETESTEQIGGKAQKSNVQYSAVHTP